jgi:hypothetical protein
VNNFNNIDTMFLNLTDRKSVASSPDILAPKVKKPAKSRKSVLQVIPDDVDVRTHVLLYITLIAVFV